MEKAKEPEKRIKKPTIKLEKRNDWLKRFEMGESAFRIADTDDFDVRTVRKHIELARQEREIRAARSAVLRDALEKHYLDLINFAENWNSEVLGISPPKPSLDSDLIESALRQHLPRSPLWGYRLKWQTLQEKRSAQQQRLAGEIERTVKADVRLPPLVKAGLDQLGTGIAEALKFQTDQWAGGMQGLNPRENLVLESAGEGPYKLRYGFSPLGKIEKERSAKVKEEVDKILVDLESVTKKWDTFQDLKKTFKDIETLRSKLREELGIIRLRRIVPGHCKYCPL